MLTSGQVTVTTTATEISGHAVNPSRITLNNHEHGAGKKVFIGNGSVTPTTGMMLNGEPYTFILNPMEHIHVITDTGTVIVGYVRQV